MNEDPGDSIIMDEEDAVQNEYREAAIKCQQWIMDSARILKGYRGDFEFAFDCWLAALGGRAWLIIGVRDQSELASRYGCTKANVSKVVKKFQGPGYLKLSPAAGQRSLNGCKTMEKKRREQLK